MLCSVAMVSSLDPRPRLVLPSPGTYSVPPSLILAMRLTFIRRTVLPDQVTFNCPRHLPHQHPRPCHFHRHYHVSVICPVTIRVSQKYHELVFFLAVFHHGPPYRSLAYPLPDLGMTASPGFLAGSAVANPSFNFYLKDRCFNEKKKEPHRHFGTSGHRHHPRPRHHPRVSKISRSSLIVFLAVHPMGHRIVLWLILYLTWA